MQLPSNRRVYSPGLPIIWSILCHDPKQHGQEETNCCLLPKYKPIQTRALGYIKQNTSKWNNRLFASKKTFRVEMGYPRETNGRSMKHLDSGGGKLTRLSCFARRSPHGSRALHFAHDAQQAWIWNTETNNHMWIWTEFSHDLWDLYLFCLWDETWCNGWCGGA